MLFLGTVSKLILPFSSDILIKFIVWIIWSSYHCSNSYRQGIFFFSVYEMLCDIFLIADLSIYFLMGNREIAFSFPNMLCLLVEGCKSFTNVQQHVFMFVPFGSLSSQLKEITKKLLFYICPSFYISKFQINKSKRPNKDYYY